MKKAYSFLLLFTVSVLAIGAPGSAFAMRFRRPINYFKAPAVSAYYDQNTGSGALTYSCSTKSVYNGHKGTDFRADVGTPVYSAASGELYYRTDGCPTYGYLGSTCGGGFGNHVRIDHEGAGDGQGWVTIYGHMRSGSTVYNQSIRCGAKIGETGASGSSTGPHLHFEVRKYSYPNNDPFVGICSPELSGYWNNSKNKTSIWNGYKSMTEMPTMKCVY